MLRDIDKTQAIYHWVAGNTHRNPKTLGCGQGDVKLMLETNNLGGKCADINAVFVALARSVGLPARDVYGIRIANSARGYKSLGKGGDITKAQHCRAEFYAAGFGWVPVDPADVRKMILEETGVLAVTDPKVIAIRDYLFGNWEMNWMAYNYNHNLTLSGSALGKKGEIPFLMYPQAENTEGRFDSLDPDNFKYKTTSRRIG
ncbi:transglutaminase-like domain-containing protein [Polynucleobacter necessarius]|uniref:transglutaminase-like domain-containing protein n=1 Tax=Polynucleobacter necessarius TaxID=576610 RepID=UPI001E566D30|nr:transglutaminase-like domain-containing protein [Polynucleobacter necessarius]